MISEGVFVQQCMDCPGDTLLAIQWKLTGYLASLVQRHIKKNNTCLERVIGGGGGGGGDIVKSGRSVQLCVHVGGGGQCTNSHCNVACGLKSIDSSDNIITTSGYNKVYRGAKISHGKQIGPGHTLPTRPDCLFQLQCIIVV